ncbi:MAG: DUF6428 family protein [Planctomycetota bacterium]|nr:DUF6428 family protein [Planctomycetota bacterium]
MNLQELKTASTNSSIDSIEIHLPGGEVLPAHFHLTEIGRVTKDFVDCGGTRRNKSACVLQTWLAEDTDHRLSAEKLRAILGKSAQLELEAATEVEFEVQQNTLSMFSLATAQVEDGCLKLRLEAMQTQCLAPDLCQVPNLSVIGGDSCTGPGCC